MSKKNITKMFLLVTLIILFIGVVSATEVSNNTDTSTTDTRNNLESVDTTDNVDTIEKSVTTKNTEKNLKASSKTYDVNDFNTLHNALTNDTYDTVNINIKTNITLENTTDVNEAIKKLNINGNGKTINGNNTYQFIKIVSGTVKINNTEIINCFGQYGGAINNLGTLTITNSILNNNKATYYDDEDDGGNGGAIYSIGNLTITNSTLKSNNANCWESSDLGKGGAIYSKGDLTITNSILNNNYVPNSDSYITKGGAVYCYGGNINITNTILNHNSGKSAGAVYANGNVTMTNCTLNNNYEQSNGALDINGNVTIINSTLNNNKAELYQCGAVSTQGNVTIINTTLNNNTASSGGAINNNGNLTIINNTINNNSDTAICNNGNLTIINSTINNNSGYSGAIRNYNGLTIIINSTLNNNNGELGGVIYARANVSIINSTLNNNTAKYGGAIYCYDYEIKTINSSSKKNGKYIEMYDENLVIIKNDILIINSTLNNNEAEIDGGVVHNNNSNINITNSIINNNKAGHNGGAIYNKANLTVINSTMNNNTASIGGAIANDNNKTFKTDSYDEFEIDRGWKFFDTFYYTTDLLMRNNKLQNNTATIGGAIYNYANNTIIENNNFITNNANMTGKAIINYGKAAISNNTNAETSKYAGTIYTNGTNVTIKNNIFHDDVNIFINSMNVLNTKYILTTKITDLNYIKLNRGRVSYTLDGKWIGSINVTNGTSWISFNVPNTGNHTIIAKYINENGIELSSDTYTFEKKSDVNVLFNAYNVKEGKVIIVSTVKDDKGNNINSGRLSYRLNGKWIGSINVKNGSSWISFNYTNTTVTFKATYINNNVTQTSYTKILNLTKLNSLKNQTSSSEDKPLKNSSVHIMINSINILNGKYVLTTKVTDNNYTQLNIGRVSYTLNGKWIGSINVKNGTSWISFNIPTIGNHSIVATYIDANGKTITTDTYSFEKKEKINILFNAYNAKNEKVTIVSLVKDDNGNNINNGRISYNLNNKWIGSITVKNGSSWINFNYTNTTVTFKATYITNSNMTQNVYTRTLDLYEIARLKKA